MKFVYKTILFIILLIVVIMGNRLLIEDLMFGDDYEEKHYNKVVANHTGKLELGKLLTFH